MNKSFSIITEDTIKKIYEDNPEAIYKAVETAYLMHSENNVINPPSYFMRFTDKNSSRIIALPAAITKEPKVSGIKWISSNPDNITRNLKRASAVIILNNYDTGYPFACLEGSLISALRTVNSAVLATFSFKRKRKINKLGIVGCGNIASSLIDCLIAQNWQINAINIYDSLKKNSEKFKNSFKEVFTEVIKIHDNVKSLVEESEVILFATTTQYPYITDPLWFTHNPLILNLSLRDLSPEILVSSNNIVDDIEHVLAAGTSPHLTKLRYNNVDFINGTIGELLKAECKIEDNKPTIISPMGMGILDLAVAHYIYNEAEKKHLTIKINDFFS